MIWGLNPERGRDYSLLKNVQCYFAAQPASQLMGTNGIFFGGNLADPSPPSTRAENEWNCACTPSYAFMSCVWPLLPLCVNIMTINQL